MAVGDTVALGGVPFFCSWSGGKDSCLALQRAVAAGGEPRSLVCMLHEDGRHTRSHGLPVAFLEAQAAAVGVPLVTRPSTWDDYERVFVEVLRELAGEGVAAGVFGDIDIQEHLDWERRVAAEAGLEAFLPLWGGGRRELLAEAFAAPLEALIVTTHAPDLGPEFIGRELTPEAVTDIEAAGVDACGENGEYHTAVTDSPLFRGRIDLRLKGVLRVDDYWQAELLLGDVEKRDDERTGHG